MKKYVLFSPVGGHDPIASYHDGALLHICRCYRPEIVYLYMSKEMLIRSDYDNRYIGALEKLQEYLDYKIKKIEILKRDDLTEVQLFDVFYSDFENIIDSIKTQYPDYEILLNISSGTPAMKNTLSIIAALSKNKITALQVSTPNKKENPKFDSPEKYDLKEYWKYNEDNTENFNNRCYEFTQENFLARIKKETIVQLIKAYDYHAAFTLAQDMREFLTDDAFALISAAKERILLNLSGVGQALNNTDYNIFPIQTAGRKREIFEYLLYLQVKQKQGNYADFIRGITPVILNILEVCLESKFNIDIKKYCVKTIKYKGKNYIEENGNIYDQKNKYLIKDSNDILRFGDLMYSISIDKLNADEEGIKIKEILEKAFNGSVEEKNYTSAQIRPILMEKTDDIELKDMLERLRSVESNVRNIAAHQMVSVTDDWIVKKIHMSSNDIMNLLKRLAVKSGINIKSEYWSSYDEMNKMIEEKLNLKKTIND